MPQPNPLDLVATDIAYWIDSEAEQIAAALIGGMAAPFSARVSEKDKLEYYTAQLFNPDGSPNYAGRTQEMNRLGAVGFAEVFKQVLRVHPEYRQEQLGEFETLEPTGVEGVSEVVDGMAPRPAEQEIPTAVPGVSEVVRPTDVPGVSEVVS